MVYRTTPNLREPQRPAFQPQRFSTLMVGAQVSKEGPGPPTLLYPSTQLKILFPEGEHGVVALNERGQVDEAVLAHGEEHYLVRLAGGN